MPIRQTITALSAKFEAARSIFSGLLEHVFFYIQTSSASSRNWKSGSLSILICNNRSMDFFISDIRRGDLRRCGFHFHWCRWRSCKMMGRSSLKSEPRAGHFPLSCSKSWSWFVQNLGFGVVMSRFSRTFSQIRPSSIIISCSSSSFHDYGYDYDYDYDDGLISPSWGP